MPFLLNIQDLSSLSNDIYYNWHSTLCYFDIHFITHIKQKTTSCYRPKAVGIKCLINGVTWGLSELKAMPRWQPAKDLSPTNTRNLILSTTLVYVGADSSKSLLGRYHSGWHLDFGPLISGAEKNSEANLGFSLKPLWDITFVLF